MTSTLGEAHVDIRAQFDKFDKDLEQQKSKLGTGLKALGKAAGTTATAGLVGVGVAATAATVAVGKFAADSTKAFIDFEQSMNEVFTLLPGISQEAMNEMSDQVLEFSQEFGRLPEEVIPALYQALSAGVPPDNVFEFLETAQKAAKGGVTELETALDGITSVVNAYGAEVLTAAEASDLMFTAVKLGKTNMDELSTSLFNVVPSAKAAGVGFEDITAALALMTAQGVPTSVATTQLRQMIVELGKEGTTASKALQEFTGQTLQEMMADGKDLSHVLQALEAMTVITGTSMQELFGSVEAGSAALALSGDKLDDYRVNLTEMENSAGATDEAFETMDSGIGAAMEKLSAFWATTQVGIGQALEPLIVKLADLAQDALPWLQEMFARAEPIIAAFSEELGGTLAPAAAVILDAFNRIGVALGLTNEEFGGMDLLLGLLKVSLDLIVTSVEAAAVVVYLLADAVEAVSKFVKDSIDGWKKYGEAMNVLGDQLPDWMIPGSPTPLELGIRGIDQALNQLPDFSSKFGGGGAPALAGVGGEGGGISNTTIVNIDGVSAMSTGSDSVDEAIRLTVQLLRDQLRG